MRRFLLAAVLVLFANAAYAAYCTPGWYSEGAALPTERIRGGGGVYDGKLIVFGGFTSVGVLMLDDTQIYDPDTDSWTAGDTVPVATLDNGYAVAPEGYAYLIAGDSEAGNYTDAVHEYDIAGDTWTTLSNPYPMAAWAPACAAPGDGYVYCFGGTTDSSTGTTNAYKYEIGSDEPWTAIADLPTAKMFADATVLNGIVYIAGGWQNDATTYAYDPVGDSYTTLDTLNNGRERPSLVTAGDLVWITGGGDGWTPIGADEMFDLTDWTATGTTIPTPVIGAIAGYIPGHGIFLAGGRDGVTGDVANNQYWQVCVPEFNSITPSEGEAGTSVTITGYWFDQNATAELYDNSKVVYPLENLVVVDESTITADIPATLAAGFYGIAFDGSLGQHTETANVFEVVVPDDDDDTTDDDTADDDAADDDAADDDAADDDAADDDDGGDDDDDDDDSGCGC